MEVEVNKIFKKDRQFKEMYVGGRWWPNEQSYKEKNPTKKKKKTTTKKKFKIDHIKS